MAIISSDGYTNKPSNPLFSTGVKPRIAQFTKEFTGSDTAAGDVLRIAQVNLTDNITNIFLFAGTMTGASDCDFGIYKSTDGGTTLVAVDADIYGDGIDLSSGSALIDVLNNTAALDRWKTVGELTSQNLETAAAQYFLCMTLNNDNTGAATLNISANIVDMVDN